MTPWTTQINTRMTRAERMELYGGAKYGGIETSTTSPNVFIYSDPERGETYGYNFDGWNADGTVFLYTGEGPEGDQVMQDGNRSVLEHQSAGRALRVFVVDGVVPGKKEKIHRYIGEFKLDEASPFTVEDAPDKFGEERTVYVFRLLPVGDVVRRPHDDSKSGDIASAPEATLVPLEADEVNEYETPGAPPSTATRREAKLVARFVASLEKQGHKTRRWRLRPAGEIHAFLTDVFDETEPRLYEAKGTATRNAVRLAIGQLYDYRRHLPNPSVPLAILLPHRPHDDVVALMQELGISCTYETDVGVFETV